MKDVVLRSQNNVILKVHYLMIVQNVDGLMQVMYARMMEGVLDFETVEME